MIKHSALATGALALVSLVAACSSYKAPPFPLPDEPGLYALSIDNKLQKLDGDRNWEVRSWPDRESLSPYTQFVVYDPVLARDARPPEQLIDVWRIAWVRSDVDAKGRAGPVESSQWAVAPIENFKVPVTYEFADAHPGFIHVIPQQPLEPGLYSLRLNKAGTARVGRLGVEWRSVDKRAYSAAHCVDRYVNAKPRYRPCGGGNGGLTTAAARGLEITLVEPLRHNNALVVQGVVTNTSETTRTVPLMQAVLFDKDGHKLTHAMIEPQMADLRGGQRMRFKTEVANAPRATARVDVEFVPMTDAAAQ